MENEFSTLATVISPECFTKDRKWKDLTEDLRFLPVKEHVQEFGNSVSESLIGALCSPGTIHHPDNLVSVDIPFFWCNYCDFHTVQKMELLKHLQSHRFSCAFCDYEVLTRGAVIKHSLKCHEAEITNTLLFLYFKQQCNIPNSRQGTLNKSRVHKRSLQKLLENDDVNEVAKKIKVEKEDDFETKGTFDQSSEADNTMERSSNDNVHQNGENISEINGQYSFTSISERSQTPFSTSTSSTMVIDMKNPHQSSTCQPDHSSQVLRSILTKNTTKNVLTSEESANNCVVNDPQQNNPIGTETLVDKGGTKIKIEIDDDSYSDSLAYVPKTIDVGECEEVSHPANSTNSPSMLAQYQNMDKGVSNNTTNPNINNSSLISERPSTRHTDTITATSYLQSYLNNHEDSPSSERLHLPILRTMLTSPEITLPRRPRKKANKCVASNVRSPDDSSQDSVGNDDQDSDYCPNSSEDEEVVDNGSTRRLRSRKKNVFVCLNCGYSHRNFKNVKDHLLVKHELASLILKDSNQNSFIYVCPTADCDFRSERFKIFTNHLEMCGVFKCTNGDWKKMLLWVFHTLQNILRSNMTDGQYACTVCAKTFNSLNDGQCHKIKAHKNCTDTRSLFKSQDSAGQIVITCVHCLAEINVTLWPELSTQDCVQHQAHCLKESQNPNSVTRQSNLGQRPSDQTPQLRAILQKSSHQNGNNTETPSSEENLPASRMLQWLISEGSRMMHFLKE